MRKKPSEVLTKKIIEYIYQDKDKYEIKKEFLLNAFPIHSDDRINEVMWLYNQIYPTIKQEGG